MLQNGGCNRKCTLLDLKDDGYIVMKFIPGKSLYSLVRCTPISVFFVLRLYKKPQHIHSFQDFLKIFCNCYADIIVIAGICQNLFYGHLYESYLPTKFDFVHFSISLVQTPFGS